MSSLVLPCPGGMPLPGPLFGIACAIIFWVLVVEFDISRKQTKRKPSLFFIRQKNQKSRKQCKSYLWEVVRNMVVEYQRQGPSNSTLMNKTVCKVHLFFIIFTLSLSTSPISSSVRRIGGRTGSGLGSWRPDWAKKSQKSSFGREKCHMSPTPTIPNVRRDFLVEKASKRWGQLLLNLFSWLSRTLFIKSFDPQSKMGHPTYHIHQFSVKIW